LHPFFPEPPPTKANWRTFGDTRASFQSLYRSGLRARRFERQPPLGTAPSRCLARSNSKAQRPPHRKLGEAVAHGGENGSPTAIWRRARHTRESQTPFYSHVLRRHWPGLQPGHRFLTAAAHFVGWRRWHDNRTAERQRGNVHDASSRRCRHERGHG
jgi:hypothetical protein